MRLIYAVALLLLLAPTPTNAQSLAERLGYSAEDKLLIVHADDVGVAHSVNQATFDAMATGLVNSTSIMIPCAWLPEVARYMAANPTADLGLHLTLTSEWEDYRWGGVVSAESTPGLYEEGRYQYPDVLSVARSATADEVKAEIAAQYERAVAMGIQPTHLDTHMGTLFATPAFFGAYLELGRETQLPILIPGNLLDTVSEEYRNQIQDQDIIIDYLYQITPLVADEDWASWYTDIVENLQPGVSQIIIHLAYDNAEMQGVTINHPDYGSAWRQRDFDFFTSSAFQALLNQHNIRLITWREIGQLLK